MQTFYSPGKDFSCSAFSLMPSLAVAFVMLHISNLESLPLFTSGLWKILMTGSVGFSTREELVLKVNIAGNLGGMKNRFVLTRTKLYMKIVILYVVVLVSLGYCVCFADIAVVCFHKIS